MTNGTKGEKIEKNTTGQHFLHLNSEGGLRYARCMVDPNATDFIMVIKASTPAAVALKENRIPFKVEQKDIIYFKNDGKGEAKDLARLIGDVIGGTMLLVSDKKKLKEGPWLDRYEGERTAEKFAVMVREVHEKILPYTNSLVFTGAMGKDLRLSGYLLSCDKREDFDRIRARIDSIMKNARMGLDMHQ